MDDSNGLLNAADQSAVIQCLLDFGCKPKQSFQMLRKRTEANRSMRRMLCNSKKFYAAEAQIEQILELVTNSSGGREKLDILGGYSIDYVKRRLQDIDNFQRVLEKVTKKRKFESELRYVMSALIKVHGYDNIASIAKDALWMEVSRKQLKDNLPAKWKYIVEAEASPEEKADAVLSLRQRMAVDLQIKFKN